ncbi:MAG: HAD family hydrolase [Alphaproteobacteria bacterium]
MIAVSDKTIRGLLFDKDGTLLDFQASWVPVNRGAAMAVAGGDEELAHRLLEVGGQDPRTDSVTAGSVLARGTAPEIASTWIRHLPAHDYDAVVAQVSRVFDELSPRCAAPVTDLPRLFSRLRRRGLRLGVATTDSQKGAIAALGRFGVLEMLDFVAGYDAGHGVKPDPGVVLAFCRELGLDPPRVAVIGDNPHDLEMGRGAGAGLVVGVLTGTGTRDALSELADHVVPSIEDLEALLPT